ncbi:MAG: stage II sporulation protein M [Anaeromassilibacillus sp.]
MHIKGTNVFQLDRWKGRLIDKASLIEAVRSNLAAVLLALCFLVGMVSGALITRNVDVSILDKVDFLFYSNFQERASQPVFSVFSASFASSFLFVLARFLCGLSLWGVFAVPAILFFRGLGLGLTSGYLYATHGFHGVIFHFLVILPGAFVCCLALLLAGGWFSRRITGLPVLG